MAHRPMPMLAAIRPEAACAWVAPTAVSPFSTTAKEDAKPTMATISPGKTGCTSGALAAQINAFVQLGQRHLDADFGHA